MVLWMSKHLPPFNLVRVKHSGRTTDVNFINGMPVLSMYTQSCTSPWTFQMADFELFNTVYNVITFVAIFGGILIIALAKHWFNVSGWLSFPDGHHLGSNIIFSLLNKKYFTFCNGMVTISINLLFYDIY